VFFRWYDITQLRLWDLRSAIAYVPKTVSYLALLSKNNIRYGDPLAEQLEVEYSAKLAQIHSEILNFRNTKTIVGERGITLSGGQRQRTLLPVPCCGRTSADFDDALQCGQSNSDRYPKQSFTRYPTQNRYLHIPPVVCCCHY